MAVGRPQDPETELVEDMARFTHDPLGWVLYAFPWGKGELVGHPGPRRWQRRYLTRLGEKLSAGGDAGRAVAEAIRMARASGHGIGKSALVSWLVLWAMSTCEDTRGVVTANTETQLKIKTWAELSKWHRLSINNHWFVFTATSLYSAAADHEKTWRVDMVPWSEKNPEAFAGLHNQGKRILIIMDEASAIHDVIWEVTEGALTDSDTEIIWAVFGNPTRNTGRFKECFGTFAHRWDTEAIDSREVEGTNKELMQDWVNDYGEDSDFVRIRVRGVFPRASSEQFIGEDLVELACRREPIYLQGDPLIMALDISRGGDDFCVFRFRRGFDGRSIPPRKIPGSEVRDSMKLVAIAVDMVAMHKPDYFFLDGTGGSVGGPIGDRIRQMGYPVIDVQFGGSSPDPTYANLRTYMWAKMREWLQAGGSIDNDALLKGDLTAPEYGHNVKDQIALERKEDIKVRLKRSPDDGDALGMTFAMPVAMKGGPGYGHQNTKMGQTVNGGDWDTFRN